MEKHPEWERNLLINSQRYLVSYKYLEKIDYYLLKTAYQPKGPVV